MTVTSVCLTNSLGIQMNQVWSTQYSRIRPCTRILKVELVLIWFSLLITLFSQCILKTDSVYILSVCILLPCRVHGMFVQIGVCVDNCKYFVYQTTRHMQVLAIYDMLCFYSVTIASFFFKNISHVLPGRE